MKVILAAILTTIFLTSCSNVKSYEVPPLEGLKKEYYEVEYGLQELPEEYQKQLVVPRELPFKVTSVTLESEENPDGEIIKFTRSSMTFSDEATAFMKVYTYHSKHLSSLFDDKSNRKKIKLKDGTNAYVQEVKGDATGSAISWKKEGIYHEVVLFNYSDGEKEYSFDDVLNTVNSMID